ncbi:PP2C family protein-serine/threonine phosphatase [Lysinimonas soli]|uniref:PP2C family protein-serine/threonine phosphatase n=1 Tax=Lysinimonas soli TaxID=1074233 RepID=A0ABW0NMK1_9MICO
MTRFGDDGVEVHVPVAGHDRDLVLSWAARTEVGHRRAANEDSVLAGLPIFAVADGMGGHAAGDRASAAIAQRLAREPGPYAELAALEQAFIDAGAEIDALAEGIPIGVGTTITGAALVFDAPDPSFLVFNIGDSRVYRYERNELSQVTIDHSVVQELVDAGLIAAEDAENHPESNVITRALGFHDEPLPDIWRVPVRAGMRLLVCSDGLTKELGDDRIRLHLAAGMPAGETASALMDAALAAGGRDNVTLIVIDVIDAPTPLPAARSIDSETQPLGAAASDTGGSRGGPPSGGMPG